MRRFESELLDFMHSTHSGLLDELKTGKVPDALADAVKAFKAQFTSSGGPDHSVDPAAVDADELGDAQSNKTLATE